MTADGVGTAPLELQGGEDAAYAQSFGNMPNKTTFYNPHLKSDMRTEMFKHVQAKLKAHTSVSGGAGTAGYAMIPVYVDPQIVDRTRKYTPLVELIKRVTNRGMYADFNVITAKGGAYSAGEDAALPETNTTYDRVSKAIKFLYAVGRVTGPSRAAQPGYLLQGFNPAAGAAYGGFSGVDAANAKQQEVLVKARELKELEENLIINGDSSTTATQFDGIVIQQSTTNQNDLSSAALTWDDVEITVQYAFDDGGRPTLAVASSSVVTDLRKIMIDVFRFSPESITATGLAFGVPQGITIHTMVGPIVVIPSMYLSNVSGAKQIFFLDMEYIEMRVLLDMTYEDLAKTNDSDKFMLKIYETLILKAPSFNSFIDNIA